jgi:hypothetical protein
MLFLYCWESGSIASLLLSSIGRFHETVSLNNTTYSNVYSNENKENVTVYTRKEKVYFNQETGLIAVRDSLGTLWTIVK